MAGKFYSTILFFPSIFLCAIAQNPDWGGTNCGRSPPAGGSLPPWTVIVGDSCFGSIVNAIGSSTSSNQLVIPEACRKQILSHGGATFTWADGSSSNIDADQIHTVYTYGTSAVIATPVTKPFGRKIWSVCLPGRNDQPSPNGAFVVEIAGGHPARLPATLDSSSEECLLWRSRLHGQLICATVSNHAFAESSWTNDQPDGTSSPGYRSPYFAQRPGTTQFVIYGIGFLQNGNVRLFQRTQ